MPGNEQLQALTNLPSRVAQGQQVGFSVKMLLSATSLTVLVGWVPRSLLKPTRWQALLSERPCVHPQPLAQLELPLPTSHQSPLHSRACAKVSCTEPAPAVPQRSPPSRPRSLWGAQASDTTTPCRASAPPSARTGRNRRTGRAPCARAPRPPRLQQARSAAGRRRQLRCAHVRRWEAGGQLSSSGVGWACLGDEGGSCSMVGCRACAAQRSWRCGGPHSGEGRPGPARPGLARSGGRRPWGSGGSCGAWGLSAIPGACFASPCGGEAAGARKPGGSARLRGGLASPAGPLRGHTARAGRAPGLSAARAWRVGEALGRRSGGVSSRRCGGREDPGRRGCRPVLPAGARRSTCLPGRAGRLWPAGGQEGSHAPREWRFWFVYFRLWFCGCSWFVFFHKGREEGVPVLPKASLDARLAHGVFLLFLALLLFPVVLFWSFTFLRITFSKKYICFGKG